MAGHQNADLLIIGGGITGAGIALDAASRGLKTILVEKGDFASGTSSRSSKLIHGGLRYLEHLSLRLMRESVRERHTLTRLAPGLVHWWPFLLPHYEGKERQWKYKAGLFLYDHLARSPKSLRHHSLRATQLLDLCPELRVKGLLGGSLFYDCITDDARLVLSLALEAQARGAQVYNYVLAEDLVRTGGKAAGALVRDTITGESWEIQARRVVSATGPWTDRMLATMGDRQPDPRIRPAKGVHIVLKRDRLKLQHTILIPSAHDRRFLFVIPWYEGILVGTTDTDFEGDPGEASAGARDVEYMLDALRWSFPEAGIGRSDLISSYAGIRPLINVPGKSTTDVPREYRIFESSGVLCVAGGKLTTYRLMARSVVDRVAAGLGGRAARHAFLPCWTHSIRVGNPPQEPFNPFGKTDLPEDVRTHLISDYGVWAKQIISILEVHPEWAGRVVEGLPYILAEIFFAVTREKARTLEDILVRRTRIALLDPGRGRSGLGKACEIARQELNWDSAEVERQVQAYELALRTRFRGSEDLK